MTEAAHRHYLECGSTNDLARAWASDPADPAPSGARVTADFQTRGRGRRGRSWDAARGQNVLLSVVLRPHFPPADAWQLAFLGGLAVADALAACGLDPRLKWPNDILLHGAKVAGILVETMLSPPPTSASGASSTPHPLLEEGVASLGEPGWVSPETEGSSWAAVVGIGLNVNQIQFARPERLLHPPTSLRLVTGRDWDVPAVARAVADALEGRLAERQRYGWDGIYTACRRRLAVGAALTRGLQRAILVDLEPDGGARVELSDGTFARWTSVEEEGRPETAPNRV